MMKIILFSILICFANSQKFPFGQFQVGRSYESYISSYDSYDYITIWINTISSEFGTDFSVWHQGDMIKKCIEQNKIPLFYAYVIAFEARYRQDIQDCDVREWNSLCTHGADFIRNNRYLLVSRYKHQASEIAKYLGRSRPAIFIIEPDFWQYYGDSKQNGGTLSGTYMRNLFDDFVGAIKSELPNALISWDISAWIGEEGFRKWWDFFKTADIDFINTSGGQPRADSWEIKPNELSWSFVSSTTGKKIIADCGYGVAGAPSSTCAAWTSTANVNNRINDGVIALSQANPSGNVPRPPLP